MDTQPNIVRSVPAQDHPTPNVPISGAPGMPLQSTRPHHSDVTASVAAQPPSSQVVQPMPQRPQPTSQPQPQQQQPAVVTQQPARSVNHVGPDPKEESGEENSGSVVADNEEKAADFEEPPREKQQQQQPEPGKGLIQFS